MGKRIPMILGFLLLALAVWVQVTSVGIVRRFIARQEALAYDIQLRTKILTHRHKIQTPIAIVDIDDKSLAAEGRWPWPRAKLADLIGRLQQEGAVVIAFDIIFPEKEANIADVVLQRLTDEKLLTPELLPVMQKIQPFFDDDARFSNSLAHIDTVLGISFLPNTETEGEISTPLFSLSSPAEKSLGFIDAPGVIGNIAPLESVAHYTGFINVFPDDDGIIRRVPILIRYKNNLYPSLALETVRLYLLSTIKLITAHYNNQLRIEAVQIGNHIIPTDDRGQVIVPFRGRSYTFPFYSAGQVLHGNLPPNALAGKIVFIGTSATGLGDLKTTAIQNIFPGVEIQATIADGILTDNFSYKPAWSLGAELFLTVFLGTILAFTFPYLGPRGLSFFIITIPIGLFFLNNWLWDKTGLIISIFAPLVFTIILGVVDMIYGYLFETRRREHLKEMFGQYVPAKHIDEMLTSSGKELGLSGEDREMTVLFADIRNFTTISEPLSAIQLKEILNEFFTPMTEIIFKHRGTIDKYVGDMIMAFWGAPLKDKRHATHALSAALDMQRALAKLRPQFAEKKWPDIHIGIGLNSGLMSVGDMGSKFRRNYTVLGDEVNLASRVEGLTKFYGVGIIVTEHTQHQQQIFVFRKLDRVRVKGKKLGIEIFEPICRITEETPELALELQLYHSALDYYFAQDWEKAETIFTELSQAHPDTKLYSLYLKRIAEFKHIPPPSPWDGVYTHTEK